jgi:hypothetical protein
MHNRTRIGTTLAALALVAVAACGGDDDDGAADTTSATATTAATETTGAADTTAGEEPTTTAGGDETTTSAGDATTTSGDEESTTTAEDGATTTGGDGSSVYDVDLTGICPDPLVIQTDWFPEPDHGYTYQAIGTEGTVDAETGTYSGPLANTGITLEVRAGGPFINFSPPAQQIYADPSIFAGYADTGDVIRNVGGEQPLVSIFASYDIGPQILMWDPEAYPDMQTIEDVKESGATVLYFEGAAYMDYLLQTGQLDAAQIDGSYDGSPGRFVAEGNLVQQGFATNEIYKYENDIPDWGKPVEFLLIHDTGFDIYQSALSVKPETIEESAECLAALVPIFQQSLVDYVTNPEPMNERFVEIVTELDTFWTLTPGGNADAVQRMLDLDLVSDAGNSTIGDFDCDRVDGLIEKLRPVFEASGITIPADTACDQVVTNEFLDPSLSLGQ